MAFGKQLKQLRLARKLTQTELANILGLSKPTISAYENETRVPDIHMATKIAKYFNVSVDKLLGTETQTESTDLKDVFDAHSIMLYGGRKLSEKSMTAIAQLALTLSEEFEEEDRMKGE